jgi:hypothetical protein
MADLLAHAATAYAPGRSLRDARLRALLYVAVCLPDLLYKGALYLLGASTWFSEIFHSPLALVPLSYAAALLFEETWRKRAFWTLLLGGWLHVAVDFGKDYLGSGVIAWAFPFSMHTAELGWYEAEQTVLLMAPALALILLVELIARLSGRRRS